MSREAVTIKGYAQIAKRLKKMSGKVGGSIARRSGAAGARVMRDEARRLAPEATGNLRNAINVRVRRFKNGMGFHFFIAVDSGNSAKHDGWYAHLIEYGVQPHELKPKNRSALLLTAASQQVWRAVAYHPGHPAQPFMRPAFDTKKDDAVRVIGKQLWKNIEREAAK